MLIMPIDMPRGCELCPCWYDGHCSLLDQINGKDSGLPDEYAYSETERDPRCPLVEKGPKKMGNITNYSRGEISYLCQGCDFKHFAMYYGIEDHNCKECRAWAEKIIPIQNDKEEKKMTLKGTAVLMKSEDWKERFIAEYWQTKIRYEKLHRLIIQREVGKLDFETPISLESWMKQAHHMGKYLYELEKQAAIHGIDLEKWS